MFGLTGLYLRAAEWLVLVAFLTGAYFWIGNHAVDEYKTEQIVLQAVADEVQQERYNKLAQDYEVAKANREVVFKTITKTVEKLVQQPAYQVPCITQEGVEAANKALGGAHE